jgi:hypothetical protein
MQLGLSNIAKPGIGSDWTNIADRYFLTSTKYFNQQRFGQTEW